MSSPTAQQPATDPQAAQAGLAILVSAAIAKLWPSLDLLNLRRSLPAFKAAVAQEVVRHSRASATLAARQYRQDRVAAGVRGSYTPIPAAPPSVQQVAAMVDWATAPLFDSAVALQELGAAPAETQKVASTAIADAKARLAAGTEGQVLSVGWDTITSNAQRDRRARGYALIPEPGCCYFCALLASRGAVFKDGNDSFRQTNRRTGVRFLPHADFPDANAKVHDHCRCHVEPVFTAYEPSAQVRQWQGLYKKTAEQIGYGTAGRVTPADMRRAFRQAYEGRPIDVSGSTPERKGGAAVGKSKTAPRPRGERTQDEIRAELTALEDNFSRLTNEQQREWTNRRMNALRKQLGQ